MTKYKSIHLSSKYRERFLDRFIVMENGCHEWNSTIIKNGYGVLRVGQKVYLAHRVSFHIKTGRRVFDVIDHICNNRACVNPDHLQEVSFYENLQLGVKRKYSKVVSRNKKVSFFTLLFDGECCNGHKINSVKDIECYQKEPDYYRCRKCILNAYRRRNSKRK